MVRRSLLLVIILITAPRIADACECGLTPPCQRFWTADAVFTGLVTNVTWSDDAKLTRTTIVVERGFRGASGKIIVTGNGLSSCHYGFTVGQRYFIYANRGADGTLTTGACSGNQLLAEAQQDLDYAEHLPPPGSGGRVFGRVRRIEQDLLDRRKSRDVYPADVPITLRSSTGALVQMRTDDQGNFEVAVKADKYSVSMDAPATARVYYFPATIDLKDRACVAVSVTYQSDGRIAGRIVDANGMPVSKVSVSAVPIRFTTKKDFPEASMPTKMTDADGRYEIGPIPQGEYQVAVNVEGPTRLDSPYPATFFPGVVTRAQAETISVRDGEMRSANFVLPQKLTRLTVSGTVLFPDGTPAPNVNVILVIGTVIGISTTRTDASGSFTLTGLSGSTYAVKASFYSSPENSGSAQTTVSLADEQITELKLVLQKR